MSQQPSHVSPDGQWVWNGQQWVPNPEAKAPGPQPPAQRPKNKGRGVLLGCGIPSAVVVVIIIIVIIASAASNGGGGNKQPQASKSTPPPATSTPRSTPAPTTKPTKAPKAPTPPPAPVTLVPSMNGSDSGESPAFNPPAHYKVLYSFDCSSFGQSGNFAVEVDDGNGQPVLGGATVNRLAMSGTGTADGYNIDGQKGVHVQVLSECQWTIIVQSA